MLKTLKKKYRFNRSIYILFFIFLIFFIKFSTISAKANSFKIADLEVSKIYDNNFNKEAVIDMAFKKAFEELILRITTLKNDELNQLLNLKTIYGLVESFSIVDEKFIDNKYVSKFEVEFDKKQVFRYLERKNIFPSIPKEKNLLLLPILIDNKKKQILLFSENLFYVNWNKFNKKHHLLNYILPNEDIEDINTIKKNINNIEEYDFNEIISKYDISDYIILILFQKENNFNALIKTNLNNKLVITNKSFYWKEDHSIEKIIEDLKIEFENQWKKLNIINVSIKLPITLSVNSKNYQLIQNLEKQLYHLDLVSNFYIDSFTNKRLIYKITYNGTPDKFINEFSNNNIKLNTNQPIWNIE